MGRNSKLKIGLNFFGAGDGTRTRACELGKLVPYHLATPAQDLMLAQHQQKMPATTPSIQNAKPVLAEWRLAAFRADDIDTAWKRSF